MVTKHVEVEATVLILVGLTDQAQMNCSLLNLMLAIVFPHVVWSNNFYLCKQF